MKVLITGGTGFLGRCLKANLDTRENSVFALGSADADLTVYESLSKFRGPYDVIFHLASWTQAGDFCLYNAGDQWIHNQLINTNVLTWWHRHQPQAKFVSIGTSCAYQESSYPLIEENYLVGQPIPDLFTYAMTKRMLLIGQQSLSKQFGLNQLTFVPSTLYGTGYNLGVKQPHFIFDIIKKVLDFKYKGLPIILWGDGYQRRELVFVDDFIHAMLALVLRLDNDVINIGGGTDYTIREFAEMVCLTASVDPRSILYDSTRYVGAKNKRLDNRKLDTLLPNRNKTNLEVGITRTMNYIEKNFYN